MTKERMFGSYLHALVAHAPPQLEIVPLSSVNAEKQERMFSQARKTAIATTNRQPQNVISSLTLRLQAKAELKGPGSAVLQNESRVAKAGKSIPKFSGTRIKRTFIAKHQQSWNEHLPRISHYLSVGEGVWWKSSEDEYLFFDGDSNESHLPSKPTLLHFRSATLQDVYKRQTNCWEVILKENIGLPTPELYPMTQLCPLPTPPSTIDITPLFPTVSATVTPSPAISTTTTPSTTISATAIPSLAISTTTTPSPITNATITPSPAISSTTTTHSLTISTTTTPSPFISTPTIPSLTTQTYREEEIQDYTENEGANIAELNLHMDNHEDGTQATCNDTQDIQQLQTRNQETIFKTKHAACIAKLLGKTPKIKEFDDLRFTLKNSKKPSNIERQRHEKLLVELQTAIQNIKSTTIDNIKHVESTYFSIHKTLPTEKTSTELAKLLKTHKLATRMLATWHVHF